MSRVLFFSQFVLYNSIDVAQILFLYKAEFMYWFLSAARGRRTECNVANMFVKHSFELESFCPRAATSNTLVWSPPPEGGACQGVWQLNAPRCSPVGLPSALTSSEALFAVGVNEKFVARRSFHLKAQRAHRPHVLTSNARRPPGAAGTEGRVCFGGRCLFTHSGRTGLRRSLGSLLPIRASNR